ncbi:methyl-accepting chemotaxis protein [Ruminococcaceae bacterium OttesenSCG-928-I18]|nr:methyl-accepting chemotaxis protein [Ruminococcaceae bacterium OttesenSCG-928-I18]
MKKSRSISLSGKLSLLVAILILVSAVSVGILGFILYRMDCIRLNGEKAVSIAESLAAGIDGDEMVQIMRSGQTSGSYDREKQMADETAVQTGTIYLYVLGADYSDTFTYYLEGYNPETALEEYFLGDEEDAGIYAEEMFHTLDTGESAFTDVYQSGEFGNMVSGFAAVRNQNGEVVGVVGADISANDVMKDVNRFGLETGLIVLAAAVVAVIISQVIIKKMIGRPLKQLRKASGQIAVGDLDIDLNISSGDEIGQLAESFRNMVDSTHHQVELLEEIAEGDLSTTIEPRSDKDKMSFAMIRTADNLNGVFENIRNSALQLSGASSQIANGAQGLAQGAGEQSDTMEQLAASVDGVAEKAQQNVEMATEATELVHSVKQNAQQGSVLMENMLSAVKEIDEASTEIAKVMKTIDDIAFQTNILALNASVEAARAGQHGKGFAVVADEVRNLASKSAASSAETEKLIDNSLEKASLGVNIASETSQAFSKIVQGISESEQIISTIADSSQAQSEAISGTYDNIGRITQVVQQNSDSAQDSAASSEELSGQAEQLKQMLAQFKLKDSAMGPALPAAEGDRGDEVF